MSLLTESSLHSAIYFLMVWFVESICQFLCTAFAQWELIFQLTGVRPLSCLVANTIVRRLEHQGANTHQLEYSLMRRRSLPFPAHVADDELDRMRQQMGECISLLASAAYEQPQSQLQHYQVKLSEHLADNSKPIDLRMAGQDGGGHLAREAAEGRAEGSDTQTREAPVNPTPERANPSGLTDSPPRTPNQDAAGKAARAKRVASSREVCNATPCCAALCHALRGPLNLRDVLQ